MKLSDTMKKAEENMTNNIANYDNGCILLVFLCYDSSADEYREFLLVEQGEPSCEKNLVIRKYQG